MSNNNGEFKKRIRELNEDIWNKQNDLNKQGKCAVTAFRETCEGFLNKAHQEYPKVSQKWVPVKGHHVDWKRLCLMMEQKIIEFENFGKKWFGETE